MDIATEVKSEMITIATDDKMAGLDTPDGRSFRPRDGLITVPERYRAYAEQAARVVPLFHIHRPCWGGFDATALRARYEAWRREQERRP